LIGQKNIQFTLLHVGPLSLVVVTISVSVDQYLRIEFGFGSISLKGKNPVLGSFQGPQAHDSLPKAERDITLQPSRLRIFVIGAHVQLCKGSANTQPLAQIMSHHEPTSKGALPALIVVS
jgi:hypothetical protein